jgi:hypothetical protein
MAGSEETPAAAKTAAVVLMAIFVALIVAPMIFALVAR